MKRQILFLFILLLVSVPLSSAQSNDLLAFLNGSGQLVVSSGDGNTRWIVTNPGQVIDSTLGFDWNAEGNLVFALEGYGAFEGDPSTQAINPLENAEDLAFLRGLRNRPNDAQPNGVSADGRFAFAWSDGRYFVVPVGTTSGFQLPLVGKNDAQGSGLWADNTPLVAYWGFDNDSGSTGLSIFNAQTNTDITALSGTSIPIPPIAWQPNSTRLVFRTGTGDVYLSDVGCLVSGCSANPLETAVPVAPSSASNVQVTADHIYYMDNQQIFGSDLSCASNNTCIDSRFVVGNNAVPLSMVHTNGNRLTYTAYASNPNDANDRIVQRVDLSCTPDCQPQSTLNGAMAGLLSASGNFLMVDINGQGLNILNISSGGLVYLTDTMGEQLGAGLTTARWR